MAEAEIQQRKQFQGGEAQSKYRGQQSGRSAATEQIERSGRQLGQKFESIAQRTTQLQTEGTEELWNLMQPLLVSPLSMMRWLLQGFYKTIDEARGSMEAEGGREQQRGRQEEAPEPEYSPPVEVFGADGHIVVRADLPGLQIHDVQVEMRNNRLSIEGHRKPESNEDRGQKLQDERSYGHFFKEVQLPEGLDANDASAKFENGVLEVKIKAPPRFIRKRIEVEVNQAQPIEAGDEREAGNERDSGREREAGREPESGRERDELKVELQH